MDIPEDFSGRQKKILRGICPEDRCIKEDLYKTYPENRTQNLTPTSLFYPFQNSQTTVPLDKPATD